MPTGHLIRRAPAADEAQTPRSSTVTERFHRRNRRNELWRSV
jgi:hypothetical protein